MLYRFMRLVAQNPDEAVASLSTGQRNKLSSNRQAMPEIGGDDI